VMQQATVLSVTDLCIQLPQSGDRAFAVQGVSFDLKRGETLCVVGESGSGKSVMVKSLLGLLPNRLSITEGTAFFEGKDILKLHGKELQAIRGRRIAMIFQEPMSALNPLHSIGRQIEEVLLIHEPQWTKSERVTKVLEILDAVKLPNPELIFHSYPHQLSGGQRQRAMIAMALILRPDILIADEPTTALDVTTQAEILKLIKDLQASEGTGVIFITHDIGVVAEIGDTSVVMSSGHIVERGPVAQVLKTPQNQYTQMLISSVPRLSPRQNEPCLDTEAIKISVNDLSKTFKSSSLFKRGRTVKAVDNVSFSLRSGETLGVVGESGSGKSTLARCIVRLIETDSGSIVIDKENVTVSSKKSLLPLRRKMQMVFQDPYGSLNPRLTVLKMVAQGPILHGVPENEAINNALELLELVGLGKTAANRYPNEFSGGQRQRIGIARALALRPSILVADEPVSALDVSVQSQVLKLLDDLKKRLGLTMLFVTHDLRVAAQVCDSILVMQRGQVVEYGLTKSVFDSPSHAYTQQLLQAIPGRAFPLWGDSVNLS
jgi:peptide/nickel transport system ATP-binding protein